MDREFFGDQPSAAFRYCPFGGLLTNVGVDGTPNGISVPRWPLSKRLWCELLGNSIVVGKSVERQS